jgi:hypothetical protein
LPSSPRTLYTGTARFQLYLQSVLPTSYHADSSPTCRVTFVPNESFCGTLHQLYRYDDDGDSDEETVIITVTGSDGGSVEYETEKISPYGWTPTILRLVSDANGYTLSYVVLRFPLLIGAVLRLQLLFQQGSMVPLLEVLPELLAEVSEITSFPAEDYTGAVSIDIPVQVRLARPTAASSPSR